MSHYETYLALLQQQHDAHRDDENSGRLAFSMHTVETKGVGQMRHNPINFDVVFVEEPIVTVGSSVGKVAGSVDPTASAAVRTWVKNANGFYVGFQPIFKVDLYLVHENTTLIRPIGDTSTEEYWQARQALEMAKLAKSCTMIHHFCFMGMAYKEFGNVVRQQAVAATVRKVAF